eukprot:gnl/TRDRNA2_/TRDRNA2_204931_c0_seq1.p1 gnl/TRDRNA2_/TRDRNA2_204931_c0~~gnl/TRDRNA2_/TRDRNA2_204931_c0_seq1.p1  ORF type:complete len:255 (-),score=35.11 gnl/TRDRNA2_/TRDRNA2_204931_c0_seq1:90-854(-)
MARGADIVATFGAETDEVPVHSQVLRLASPVFDAMFEQDMAEQRSKRFKVDKVSKDDFMIFYQCLLPGARPESLVSETNLETVLMLSDYYQVQFMKDVCANILESLSVSIPKLVLARKYGLERQYSKFLGAILDDLAQYDFALLNGDPDTMMDIILAMQKRSSQTSHLNLEMLSAIKQYFGPKAGIEKVGQFTASDVYHAVSSGGTPKLGSTMLNSIKEYLRQRPCDEKVGQFTCEKVCKALGRAIGSDEESGF